MFKSRPAYRRQPATLHTTTRLTKAADMECFKIRTYGRMELAQTYCPDMNPRAAYHKLTQWIDRYPNLRERLAAIGASPKSRTYTPAQVKMIVEALGEP